VPWQCENGEKSGGGESKKGVLFQNRTGFPKNLRESRFFLKLVPFRHIASSLTNTRNARQRPDMQIPYSRNTAWTRHFFYISLSDIYAPILSSASFPVVKAENQFSALHNLTARRAIPAIGNGRGKPIRRFSFALSDEDACQRLTMQIPCPLEAT